MVSSFKFEERLVDRQEAAEAKRVSDLEAAAKAEKLAHVIGTEFTVFAETQGVSLGTTVEGATVGFTHGTSAISVQAVADDRFLVALGTTSVPQESPTMHDKAGTVDALIDWLFWAHGRPSPS